MTRLALAFYLTLAAIAATVAVAPRAAWADGTKDVATTRAKRHFEKGEKLFALGQFAEALDEYKAAYEAKPIPAFLFNVGQCYRNLGDFESAIFSYKKYLQLAPDAANRSQVEKLIDELEAKQEAEQERQAAKQAERERETQRAHDDAKRTEDQSTEPERQVARSSPFYTKWWFWTGVLVVAGGAGVGIYEATRAGAPATDLGPPLNFRQ
jgi:tetratricopeptide (TPR) repeat protein